MLLPARIEPAPVTAFRDRDKEILVFAPGDFPMLVGQCTGLSFAALLASVSVLLDPFWVGLVLLVVDFGIWRLVTRALWNCLRIVIGEDGFWLVRQGRRVRGIEFRWVESFYFGGKDGRSWLCVNLVGEKPGLEILRGSYVWQRKRAERRLFRMAGPRVARFTPRSLHDRPDNLIEARLYDYFDSPPPVEMVPGVRYRYSSAGDLRSFLKIGGKPSNPKVILFTSLGPVLAFCALHSLAESLVFVAAGIVLLSVVESTSPKAIFARAFSDRFEVVPEGLRVYRGDRQWFVRNPRPAVGFGQRLSIAERPVVCYGSGAGAYYFDPRFIVPDL